MHKLLSCSGKSCALFKINFARWLILELFIWPKERGGVGQVTVVLPDSAACLSSFLDCCNMFVMMLYIISVSLFLLFLLSLSLQCIAMRSDTNEYLLLDKPSMYNKLSACSNSGKTVDYSFVNGLTTFIQWNVKDNDNTVLRWKLKSKKSALRVQKNTLAITHW